MHGKAPKTHQKYSSFLQYPQVIVMSPEYLVFSVIHEFKPSNRESMKTCGHVIDIMESGFSLSLHIHVEGLIHSFSTFEQPWGDCSDNI